MADDMRRGGLMDEETHQQITMRHLGPEARKGPPPLSPDDIRVLRERAHMSQAVFAMHLNMSPGQLSKLERGTEQAAGPTLVLLSAIKRKGIEVIL
jgi:putative transcriptional regulator